MIAALARIEELFDRWMNLVFSRIKQPEPTMDKLFETRLISHRGVFDNRKIYENTLPAFQKAADKKVWGIELDIRWTQDFQPVVYHDPDLMRLFGSRERISELQFKDLREKIQVIASLQEVVEKFGGKCHLMVEIKSDKLSFVDRKNRVLKEIFSTLTPCKDYHFIAFNPEMYRFVDFAPPSVFLPIARANIGSLSRQALAKGFGGICGHYALMSHGLIKRHQDVGQGIGTGFPNSPNCLYREICRGVKWIFSDTADVLQQMISEQCDSHPDITGLNP